MWWENLACFSHDTVGVYLQDLSTKSCVRTLLFTKWGRDMFIVTIFIQCGRWARGVAWCGAVWRGVASAVYGSAYWRWRHFVINSDPLYGEGQRRRFIKVTVYNTIAKIASLGEIVRGTFYYLHTYRWSRFYSPQGVEYASLTADQSNLFF